MNESDEEDDSSIFQVSCIWRLIFVTVASIVYSYLYIREIMTFSDQGIIFSAQKVKGILLAFNFHWNNGYPALEFLRNDYIPFFKRHCRYRIDVVFFGPGRDAREVYDNGLPENGWFSYKTLSLAYKMKPGYDGYILLNDVLWERTSIRYESRPDA